MTELNNQQGVLLIDVVVFVGLVLGKQKSYSHHFLLGGELNTEEVVRAHQWGRKFYRERYIVLGFDRKAIPPCLEGAETHKEYSSAGL